MIGNLLWMKGNNSFYLQVLLYICGSYNNAQNQAVSSNQLMEKYADKHGENHIRSMKQL